MFLSLFLFGRLFLDVASLALGLGRDALGVSVASPIIICISLLEKVHTDHLFSELVFCLSLLEFVLPIFLFSVDFLCDSVKQLRKRIGILRTNNFILSFIESTLDFFRIDQSLPSIGISHHLKCLVGELSLHDGVE